ncbi:MAG TPA: ribonuclease HII [Candidatus Kerfeldbacteria bacterium]|nr:ribonuclease HII [Candidatus Kerfeldbacteria bacterium]
MRQYKLVGGADEAGRGAWAGPLVAAAVVMPEGKPIRGVKDSKQLTSKQRTTLFPLILKQAISCVVVSMNVTEVDQLGVHQANLFALSHCITHLEPQPDLVLVDGFQLDHFVPTKQVIHGDARHYQIAAASIVAKVVRDTVLQFLDSTDHRYQFGRHKGYGTIVHRAQLKRFGPSVWHRRSFAPIAELLYTE